jgi:hypothetical protein
MAALLHFYELFHQAHSATQLPGAIAAFRAVPSAETAFQVGGKVVGVLGTDRVVGSMVKYGVKLALRAGRNDRDAGGRIVELARSRVAQDTGTLFNGIESDAEGEVVTVTASAVRTSSSGKEEENYALFVEKGTRPGVRGGSVSHVADEGFYSGTSRPKPRTRRVYRTHPGTPARPFFYNSAEEVLGDRYEAARAAADDVPDELR